MNQLKIGPRLAASYGVILLFMFLAIAFGIRSLGMVDARATQIAEGDLAKIQLVGTVRSTVRANVIRLLEMTSARSKDDAAAMMKDVDANNVRIEETLAKLKPLLYTAEDKSLFETIVAKRAAFADVAGKILAATEKGDAKRALEIYTESARPKLDDLTKNLGSLSELQVTLAGEDVKQVKAAYAEGRNLLVGFGAIALLASVVLAWLIVRSITKPIARSVTALDAVANGKLDNVVDAGGKDETGQLLRSIGDMQAKLLDRETVDADSRGQLAAINKAQAVIEFTLDGKILHANPNFLGALGYTLDEVVGQHHSMFVESPRRARRPNTAPSGTSSAAASSTPASTSASPRAAARSGSRRPTTRSWTPPASRSRSSSTRPTSPPPSWRTADAAGQLAAINKAQAVIEFGLDGKILDANENFLKTLGYSLAEIQGQHHSMFVEPATAPAPSTAPSGTSSAAASSTPASTSASPRAAARSGSRPRYNPILDASGKPFKVVKYATDITAAQHPVGRLRRPARGDQQGAGRHRVQPRRQDPAAPTTTS